MQIAQRSVPRLARVEAHDGAASLFQKEWQIYRKVVEENYFFHREAYATLREVLTEEMAGPFRFLDIACGDASDSVRALVGTRVFHYHGIDLSEPALELARKALQALSCLVTLERRDFVAALRDRSISTDVAWIGLSLHHLQTPQKLTLMCDLRIMLGERGKLLVYEPSGPDGDTRDAWLKRWDRQRTAWRAFTPEEWRSMRDHSYANDFPETNVTWLKLGYEAGFGRARCLYESPTRLFRLYCFEA
jgi:SAM-dependent methyltransferase